MTDQHKDNARLRTERTLKKVQDMRKSLVNQKEESATKFCKNLRYLMNCLYLKNKKDDDILQMQERVRIATQTNPITVIQTAGPYFYKYRNQLAKRDMNFFLSPETDFRNDVAEANRTNGGDIDVDSTPEVVQKMRETWSQYSSPERNVIMQKAVEMLGYVAQYTKADKTLVSLKSKLDASRKK